MLKMFKNSVPVGLLALTIMLSGCGGNQANPQPANPKIQCDSGTLDRLGLKELWQRELPLFNGDSIYHMLTMGGNLYITTSNRAMYCVSSQTGNPAWGLRVTTDSEPLFSPVFVENAKLSAEPLPPSKSDQSGNTNSLETYDIVLVNTPSHLYAINNETGKILRDIKLGFMASQAVACEGNIAQAPGEQATINEISLLFGAPGKSTYTGVETDVPVMSIQGNFYIAGTNGQVLSYNTSISYTRMWSFDVQGAVKTPGVANYRGVFLASGDGRIYGLDITSGRRLWQPVRINGNFTGPMTADNDRLYQFASGTGLVAIDMNDGNIAWTISDGLMVLSSFDEKVFVLSRSKELIAVKAATGELIGRASLKKFDRFASNTTLRGIYAATSAGKMICLSPKDVEDVTVEMLRSK